MINIEKGRLRDIFNASFKASEAVPRLVKVEAGIKANVPGKGSGRGCGPWDTGCQGRDHALRVLRALCNPDYGPVAPMHHTPGGQECP